MKKIIYLMSVLTIVIFSWASAQEQNKDVPKNVTSAFSKMYPSVKDTKWHKEDGNYEAKFTDGGKEMSIQLNGKAELVQKEIYIKVSELPKAAQDYLTKHYAGVNFDEASQVTNAKGVKHYQAETKGKTVVFDAKGAFMKEEKDND